MKTQSTMNLETAANSIH